jgi:hypothetical protein
MRGADIDVKDLIDWQSSELILYANSSREKKRIYAKLSGGYVVMCNDKTVYEGCQAFDAVKAYNSITEKHIPVKAHFKF